MSKMTQIIYGLKRVIVKTMPHYDQSNATDYPRKKRDKKVKDTNDLNETKRTFNVKALQFETHTLLDNDADEWVLHGMDKLRQSEFTKQDELILKSRELDKYIDKAKVIKPLWAEMKSRAIISAELTNKRHLKGYSEATVGKICAALSYSNGEHEDSGEGLYNSV